MTVSTRSAINPPLLGFKATDEWYADETDATCAPTKEFEPGFLVWTDDNKLWQLVKATAAKTKGLAYVIDEDYLAGDAVDANGSGEVIDDGAYIGIPAATSTAPTSLHADATHTYFWIQVGGVFDYVETAAAVADGGTVHVSNTAGKLDDGDDSGLGIAGARWTTATSGASNTTMFCPVQLTVAP